MAIISQVDHTKFRKLKFSNSSNQPYIQKPIPDGDVSISPYGQDFLIRGGSLLPGRIVDDVSRLTQMFLDTKSPNGIMFTTKQNLLASTEVDPTASSPSLSLDLNYLNRRIYLPTSTIAQAALTPLGQHITKQGIIPTSPQINEGLSLFTKYIQKGVPGRLETLYNTKIKSIDLSNVLYLYAGGPNSFGVTGNTVIKRTVRTGVNNVEIGKWVLKNPQYNEFSTSDNRLSGVSKIFGTHIYTGDIKLISDENQFTTKIKYPSREVIDNWKSNNAKQIGSSLSYNDVSKLSFETSYSGSSSSTRKITDFRTKLPTPYNVESLDYTEHEQTYPGRVNFRTISPASLNYANTGSLISPKNAYDKINALNIYHSDNVKTDGSTNDLVKFRIAVIDNNNPSQKSYIHFRAYIDSFSDSYSSDWDSFKYSGRGENLYRYKGFTREINLSWTVVAQSKAEMFPMYSKLNYLASSLTPDYSTTGYMRGNMVQLTIGGYLYEQPGIITSLTYDIPQETPWEIGIGTSKTGTQGTSGVKEDPSVKELPHIIKVTGFKFIPIHDFVPKIQDITYNRNGNAYGDQRYIALSNRIDPQYSLYNYKYK